MRNSSIVIVIATSAMLLLGCTREQNVVDRRPPQFQPLPTPELAESANQSSVFEIERADISAFLEFVGNLGWYSHSIISADSVSQTLVVRDGINHEFTLSFDFAEQHLRQDHHLGSYIDEMGLYNFLIFAMKNNLYEHEIGPVNPQDEVVLIFGDKGTDFATEFYMTFEKIIKHMQNDHKWTNKELLDAGYCEEVFMNLEIDSCIKRLTK